MEYYEEEKNFSPVLSTAISLMRSRNQETFCELILKAEVNVQNTDYDNWNGGTYGYTVFLNLPVKVYASMQKDEIEEAEKVIGETLNEVTKGDDNHYFGVQIAPRFTTSDIDWDIIGGEPGKMQLKADIEAVKDLMIAVSTGGPRIQEVDARYKSLNGSVHQRCKQLNIKYNNNFVGLWDWYGKWSSELPTYQSRRLFINELFAPTLTAFEENGANTGIAVPIVELNGWDRINRTVVKIKQDSVTARIEEDYQQIGLLCREVIISLAQAVYQPEVHGATDEEGITIGQTDANRMISNYLTYKLAGSSNQELRTYAKNTNKLANLLTHKRDASRKDMLMAVSATIALINFIGILEDKV